MRRSGFASINTECKCCFGKFVIPALGEDGDQDSPVVATKLAIPCDVEETRQKEATKAEKHRLFGKVAIAKTLEGHRGRCIGGGLIDLVVIPGVAMIKNHQKKATKADKHRLFGKVVIP